MNLSTKIDAALKFARLRITNSRMPLIVRWNCTNKCSARCSYCNTYKTVTKELTTSESLRMLRDLHGMGMRRLCFSGGEPLMRHDIEELVHSSALLGVSLEMNSNGLLINRHLDVLRQMQWVKVSLDGPEEIHDTIRGVRMFSSIMSNLAEARRAGVRFSLTTTLVRENTTIPAVDALVEIARSFDTFVAFQPVVTHTKWTTVDIDRVGPEPEAMQAVVGHLIEVKRRHPSTLRNSLAGLRHISSWPEIPPMRCTSGRVFVIVESNGDLYACERTTYPDGTVFPNVRQGVARAFENIVLPQNCAGCGFCGALELNFLWNLKLSSWREMLRVVGR
jgi:MoaA/NifB/PqqE/SkfB family radical SAM enzyme